MKSTIRRDRRPALLAALLLSAVVQGDMLTYNSKNKQLSFRCPTIGTQYPEDKVMFIQLARKSYPADAMANWTSSQGAAFEGDRLTLLDAQPPSFLAARLDYVTCRDSATYRCFTSVDSKEKGVYNIEEERQFKYEGEITDPVLRTSPRQSRYKIKDIVTFNCTAHIGWENNTFVWETKLPGENFTPVNETGNLCTKIKQETKITPTCDIEAETTLELELNANDDQRLYRCRLQQSNHTDYHTVSVECLNANNCLVPCRSRKSPGPKPEEVTGTVTTSASADPRPDQRPDWRVGASQDNSEEKTATESGLSSATTLLVLIAVLPITATIALIAAIILRRNMRVKQVPPLVVMESPPPTEYGGSMTCYSLSPAPSRASRRLPDIPACRDSHTTSSTTTTTYTTANDDDDDDDTNLKMLHHDYRDCNRPSRPTSSVYVSMSAINFETSDQGAGAKNETGVKNEGAAGRSAPQGAGFRGEREEPGMRTERTGSVYSNSAAIRDAEAARARANSADSDGGSGVRAHATFRKEPM